jgi:hypothetical protein
MTEDQGEIGADGSTRVVSFSEVFFGIQSAEHSRRDGFRTNAEAVGSGSENGPVLA